MTPTETGERFVITEIEGYTTLRPSGTAPLGLSCHILDTAMNYRMVATFRTEAIGGPVAHTPAERFVIVREQARVRAAQLNAGLAIERQLQLTA
jgi:hypothetical protein